MFHFKNKILKQKNDMELFTIDSSPHVKAIHDLLSSQAICGNVPEEAAITRMSSDLVIQRLKDGKLKGIQGDMKLSKSIFYHFYTKDFEEVIIQISADKLAVFYDKPDKTSEKLN
jgi:hypothetical protein